MFSGGRERVHWEQMGEARHLLTQKNNYYIIRNVAIFSSINIETVTYGLQTISCMGPNIVLKGMKQVTTQNEFQAKIKI